MIKKIISLFFISNNAKKKTKNKNPFICMAQLGLGNCFINIIYMYIIYFSSSTF